MEDQKMNKEWCSLGSSEDIFFLFFYRELIAKSKPVALMREL